MANTTRLGVVNASTGRDVAGSNTPFGVGLSLPGTGPGPAAGVSCYGADGATGSPAGGTGCETDLGTDAARAGAGSNAAPPHSNAIDAPTATNLTGAERRRRERGELLMRGSRRHRKWCRACIGSTNPRL